MARSKRAVAVLGLLALFLVLLVLTTLKSQPTVHTVPEMRATGSKTANDLKLQGADLQGHTIMPKLGNETAKAELGRAAWKLFHTTMARFPDKPTSEESSALKAYIHLFQRLYPCGECAQHFRKIIDKFPPQVATRSTAAAWACHVHNEVNKSLDKELFDCSNIGDFYDCGCAEDEKDAKRDGDTDSDAKNKKTGEKPEMSAAKKEMLTGENGREFNEDVLPRVIDSG
ncbi:FAD-linked sulfhydryl oxidase [Elsinoe australis]|uniref:Sulfhydryl oxidase n=1 Tax=Elsinoe australis TaxID=40998 RepID=A0A4U7BBB0_9PEZI|nr:FAD-linked sulfhydryl oxidase [Elsinoe australis]